MKYFCFTLILVISFSLKAQEIDHTFRPFLSAGVVGSQVDGDTYAGYNKPGYYFGFGINRQISQRWEIEFALSFLQKGARKNYALDSASRNDPNNQYYVLRLNYLEVPLMVKWNYKKFRFGGGLAAGYLTKNPPFEESQNGYYNIYGFKNFDFSYLFNVDYKLAANWYAAFRFEYSFIAIRNYYSSSNGIYHGNIFNKYFNLGLYNNMLLLSINYRFPSKATNTTTNAAQ